MRINFAIILLCSLLFLGCGDSDKHSGLIIPQHTEESYPELTSVKGPTRSLELLGEDMYGDFLDKVEVENNEGLWQILPALKHVSIEIQAKEVDFGNKAGLFPHPNCLWGCVVFFNADGVRAVRKEEYVEARVFVHTVHFLPHELLHLLTASATANHGGVFENNSPALEDSPAYEFIIYVLNKYGIDDLWEGVR